MTNKIIKIILFLLGLSILIALIQRIGLSEIITTISKADFRFIFWGIFFYIVLIFVRALKWLLLIGLTENKIKYKQLLPVCLVNSLLRNLTPFRSGEAVIPLLLKRYLKIPVGQGFSVFILDRFFELLIFTLILFFSVFYIMNMEVENGPVLSVLQQVFIVLIVLIVILVIVITSKKTTLKILGLFNFLKKNLFLKRVLEFIEKELDVFYNTLPLFKSKKLVQIIIPLTFLAWFFEILAFYLVFSSVVALPFAKVAVAQVVATAATFITFLPGGLGIAEGSLVYILRLFGYSSALTLSGALLARIFLTSTLLIAGIIGSLLLKEKCEDSK